MSDALQRLLRLLDLEDLEVNVFRGRSPDETRQRVFGGQVLAQALVAAGRTVPSDRFVHSLHAYFLRPGDPKIPILYEVDRSRDGRSFTSRRVVAIQHGEQIFNMSASFQTEADGLDHQGAMPDVPDAAALPSWIESFRPHADKLDWIDVDAEHSIELRYVEPLLMQSGSPMPNPWRVWFKTNGRMPDDHLLHCAVAAYGSDLILLDSTVRPHGIGWFDERVAMATIDHAMWFHRDFRVDDWLLYELASPSASGARGLACGELFRADGVLAASMVQEGLIRIREREHPPLP